jgi:hypothetical protein
MHLFFITINKKGHAVQLSFVSHVPTSELNYLPTGLVSHEHHWEVETVGITESDFCPTALGWTTFK